MAEETDRDSQTEEATEKKLSDAIARGVVPISYEASLLATLVGMLAALTFVVPSVVERVAACLAYFIDDPSGWTIDRGNDATALFNLVVENVGLCLAPVFAVMIVFGLVASMAQNTPQFVLDRITPKASRISMREGFSRIFGLSGWTTFAKNVVKFGSVSLVAILLLDSHRQDLLDSAFLDVSDLPYRIRDLAIRLVSALVVATVIVAAVDLVWARIHWRRSQRMSRHEIKEEMKQIEGDPLLKSRLRSIRLDRARKRMLTAVPRATMVVVNPTHYAVALRYVRSEGGAPLVVAKGLDLVALKIREIAEEHGIPIIEDKPLARSLYEAVRVDKLIPPEFYRAIAEIIYLIHRKKKASGQS